MILDINIPKLVLLLRFYAQGIGACANERHLLSLLWHNPIIS